MSTKWRGALFFGGLLAASTATFALRTVVFADHTGAAALPAASTTTQSSGTTGSGGSGGSGGSSKSAGGSKTTRVTGDSVQTRYGPIQVRVTFAGTRITEVETLRHPDDDRRSQRINEFAIPQLRAEVLASQSADIDTVSGATYTSGGYAQSVQSAIDKH